ncbi:methionine--tRNA ligase [Halalkalicoccus jeotgali]|uniref:Methionine--tRNA ligase n=1 Tax=Halalkalicoccus jeotgali (strain DSM 18796 / CECT 7217 / JCM 14584 / KCTC 4019 / B3) TaxID=795797 RepID=D8J7I8_HALJB|nr:methionine--tRNA ligase [Halalkalicoccus jeotgali]ADJ16008.1 methionyl-tRNA synthetase [Halalkalicoccus jeotgali B3]ELY38104.1 methionyl-tRNA ligase [Halalkalicoccus jeotgali B3]
MSHDEYPTDHPAVVTCGLPYANGDLHIGHLRTYVSGDTLARSLRRLGQQTAFVSGSDMHGTPVAVNAEREGITPEEFALEYHEEYAETFPEFGVEFDNYGHTHDETNTELTREFVREWIDNGHVYEKEIQVAWDPEVDQPLPDRYVEGTCPYCGEKARGDECDEGCQRHLEPGEIEDPTSTLTGNPAEYRTREHEFLRLSDFQEYLKGFLGRLEGTDNAKNQPKEWVEGELQDLCITRDMDWGIEYPEEGKEDLVLYVWVDAPIEYVASTKQYTERVGEEVFDWAEPWKEGDGELIHVIGRDIIQHHTVFWPSMLRGADYNEPRAVMASGFVNLDGKAFSTSRNRAIWADDYLAEGFDPDLLRYYLVTTGGFQQDVDFSWERFQERVNGELVGNFGNFVYRSLLFAHRNFEGTPSADVSEEVRTEINAAMEAFRRDLNEYSLREASQAGIRLSRFGNEYIQRNEPWKLVDEDPEEAARVIRDCVQLAKAAAVLLEPILPHAAERLWAQFGEAESVHDTRLEDSLEAPPTEFGEPEALFEKVEDERVTELNEKLQERVAAASAAASSEDEDTGGETDEDTSGLESLAEERIGFEEFQELDIRVGEIELAEGIEGADDLARLEVDIGVETRQIVAGIKRLHDLEELPGTRVVILANLEPAELFGVESNGMVLAAGEDADLLTTLGDSDPGTKVR